MVPGNGGYMETLQGIADRLGINLTPPVREKRNPPTTRQRVKDAIEQAASDGWAERETPGALERTREIAELAREQLSQDNYSTAGNQRDSIGGHGARGWVQHFDPEIEEDKPFWHTRTDDQLALEKGLEMFLDRLPADLRPEVRMFYDTGMTVREIGVHKGMSHVAVLKRLNKAHDMLREMLRDTLPKLEAE